jgi:hypothetical protein
MIDRPILFSAPMVKALLDGRKTQTRRLAWRGSYMPPKPSPWQKVKPGDRLWVRETHYVESAGYKDGRGKRILYRATEPDAPTSWTPAIHMYRFASRLTLEVVGSWVEPLQDISDLAAIGEGVTGSGRDWRVEDLAQGTDPRSAFSALWWALHGIGSWQANPDVVVIGFKVHHRNIDQEPK